MYSQSLLPVALAGMAQAHMSMYYPPPLGGAPSINKQSTSVDKEFNFPLGCCGPDGSASLNSPGICRGHLDKYDTETAQVTWSPGQDAYFQLTRYTYDPKAPGSTHSGGSCQVGFSVDKGATWKVAASYHGACPHETVDGSPEAQTFDFKVPTGMPEGDALFAWVWLNREHESFMNCAKVHIEAHESNSTTTAQSYPPIGSSTALSQPIESANLPEHSVSSSPSPEESSDSNTLPSHTDHDYLHSTPVTATSTYSPTATQTTDDRDVEGCDTNSDTQGSDPQQSSSRPHPFVKRGARRYVVEGSQCECVRNEFALATRCFCDDASSFSSLNTRSAVERKALRMHRRALLKRVDACHWPTAPSMEVSYFTKDAKCSPNAKANYPQSDHFELAWDVSCGVVKGETDYQLKTMSCDMFAAP